LVAQASGPVIGSCLVYHALYGFVHFHLQSFAPERGMINAVCARVEWQSCKRVIISVGTATIRLS
jgi:hypothetical protein